MLIMKPGIWIWETEGAVKRRPGEIIGTRCVPARVEVEKWL